MNFSDLEDSNKIKILFLSADPTNAARLRLDQELRDIQERLRIAKLRHKFEFKACTSIRTKDITQELVDFEPHFIHFSGHGTEEGELCIEDEQGKKKLLTAFAFSSLLEWAAKQTECVLLNACYTDIQAQVI